MYRSKCTSCSYTFDVCWKASGDRSRLIHVWNAETCHLLHSTLTRQHRDAISVSLQPVSALLFYSSSVIIYFCYTLWFKKNAPTLADYNYEPVLSILIIFSKLFVNDHKSCLVVKFSTLPHICCHYTLCNTMLYFALITLLIAKKCANFGSP